MGQFEAAPDFYGPQQRFILEESGAVIRFIDTPSLVEARWDQLSLGVSVSHDSWLKLINATFINAETVQPNRFRDELLRQLRDGEATAVAGSNEAIANFYDIDRFQLF